VGTFKYIKSEENPADALTRGIPDNQLDEWMKGPEFLKLPDDDYLVFNKPTGENEEISETEYKKVKKPVRDIEEIQCNASSKERVRNSVFEHILQTCLTFRRARRVLAFVLRFTHYLKTKQKKSRLLSVNEIEESEKLFFKWAQTEQDPSKIDKKLLAKIDDEGILRALGRLEKIRTLPCDMRNPIILPRNYPLVVLLVKHLHEISGHCGYQRLIHKARRKYWIIGLRKTAKYLTQTCVTCRKLCARPLEQLMG
jgi:hypothetical protein